MKKILRRLSNVLRVLIISGFMSCLLTFSLIMINAVMRIFIPLEAYFVVFSGLTIGLTVGLVLFNYKKIFYSKKKIQKNNSSISNRVSRDKQKKIIRAKRKIS